jgi:23S rRNA (uracil1939-C5)-methyltransferase
MSRRRKLKSKSYEIEIESLSHEGRGISHIDNNLSVVIDSCEEYYK